MGLVKKIIAKAKGWVEPKQTPMPDIIEGILPDYEPKPRRKKLDPASDPFTKKMRLHRASRRAMQNESRRRNRPA